MLLYARPDDYVRLTSWYHIVTKAPALCANAVCHYRLLGLLSRIIGAVVLAIGACSWLKRHDTTFSARHAACLVLIAVIANLLSYAILPQAISYNGVSAMLLFCAGGLLLWSSNNTRRQRSANAACAIAGICVGFCLFAKITSAAGFFVIMPLVLIGSKAWRQQVTAFVLGVVVAVGTYFLFFDRFETWLRGLEIVLQCEAGDNNHLQGARIIEACTEVAKFVARNALVFGPAALSFLLYRRKHKFLSLLAAVAVIGSLCYVATSHYCARYDVLFVFGFTYLLCTLTELRREADMEPKSKEYIRILIFLTAFPFCVSLGSNNPVFWHAATNICPLAIMIVLCSIVRGGTRTPVVAATFATLCAFLFVEGFYFHPYRLGATMFQQSLPLAQGKNLSGILLDPTRKQVIDQTRVCLNQGGFKENDPILAFYDIPGLVYAVDGRSVGVEWMRSFEPNLTLFALKQVKAINSPRLFMLVDGSMVPNFDGTAGMQPSQKLSEPQVSYLGVAHGTPGGWPNVGSVYVYRVNDQGSLSGSRRSGDDAASRQSLTQTR